MGFGHKRALRRSGAFLPHAIRELRAIINSYAPQLCGRPQRRRLASRLEQFSALSRRGTPICAEWRPHAVVGLGWVTRACPAPSPRRGAILMRVLPPAPSCVGEIDRQGAGGKDATGAAPCVRPGRANLPARSAATRHRYAAGPIGRACCFRPICCAFTPFAETPGLTASVSAQEAAAGPPVFKGAAEWREKTEDWQVKTGGGRPIPLIWGQHVH